MEVLVTGASGLLGRRFYHTLGKKHDVVGTYYETERRDLYPCDVTHSEEVTELFRDLRPDVVVHSAAMADPDDCYRRERRAFEVNHRGTANVADATKEVDAKLVYISTSFVFPGNDTFTTDDDPDPRTIYGRTKVEGEKAVRDVLDDYVILRCPKLFGATEHAGELTTSILEPLLNDERLELDDTVKRYPVLTDDVVDATQRLVDIDGRGTYHISTDEPLTKYEFGRIVAETFGVEGELVPVDGDAQVERPSGIKLDATTLQRLGIDITPVERGVEIVKHQLGCSFKKIYSYRPDRMVKGQSASKVRATLGKELGRGDGVDADIVVPIPESGVHPATGYADVTDIPLYHGFIRDYETEKTLHEPNTEDRLQKLRKKLVPVPDLLEDQRVVLVDEAILSGLTLATVVDKCRSVGVDEIHVRIPSPPMRTQCHYDVLSGDADLVTSETTGERSDVEARLVEKFDLESVRFLPLERFEATVPSDYSFTCTDCFERGGMP